MARVPGAAVLGLLAGAVGLAMTMTATDAFQPPAAAAASRHLHLTGQQSSLSEAPALGAWQRRPRPSRGGVVLHARWPFGRRGRDKEKEEGTQDTAQVRCFEPCGQRAGGERRGVKADGEVFGRERFCLN